MHLPEARIAHRMNDRVRFRIPDLKGDVDYFAGAAKRLADAFQPERLEANPRTGSLLIVDAELDIDAVVSFPHRRISSASKPFNPRHSPGTPRRLSAS